MRTPPLDHFGLHVRTLDELHAILERAKACARARRPRPDHRHRRAHDPRPDARLHADQRVHRLPAAADGRAPAHPTARARPRLTCPIRLEARSRSSSPTWRLRRASGSSSPTRCALRSPSTTRSCATPSRATVATSSSRPATGSTPRSTRRTPVCSPRWTRNVHCVAHDWSEATGPLRVRMGLHSGEAELRDGDYFGPAVNRAARIMAVGERRSDPRARVRPRGSSRTSHCPGVELLDLGEHRLRDIARPDRLFQVCAGDLPRLFPPLATRRRRAGQPPARAQLVRRSRGRHRRHRCRARGRPARHADRRRRRRQDAAGARGREQLPCPVPATARGGASWHAAGDADALVEVVAGVLATSAQPGLSLEASILELLAHP